MSDILGPDGLPTKKALVHPGERRITIHLMPPQQVPGGGVQQPMSIVSEGFNDADHEIQFLESAGILTSAIQNLVQQHMREAMVVREQQVLRMQQLAAANGDHVHPGLRVIQ